MTWTCKYIHPVVAPESGAEREAASGARTATRVYRLSSSDETLDSSTLVRDKFGQTPTTGDQLPNYGFTYGIDGSMLAAFADIECLDSSIQLWQVTWHYKTLSTGEIPAGQPGHVEWKQGGGGSGSSDGEVAWKDKWKLGYSMPPGSYPDASVPPGTEAVVNGQSIDAAGEPVSAAHISGRVTILEVLDQGAVPNWNAYEPAIGKRNSTTFGGKPPGKLLYLVPSVSYADGIYTVEHHFAWDQDFHLVQMARRKGDGRYETTDTAQVGQPPKLNASIVYWVQPFPQVYNFFGVSPNFVGFA